MFFGKLDSWPCENLDFFQVDQIRKWRSIVEHWILFFFCFLAFLLFLFLRMVLISLVDFICEDNAKDVARAACVFVCLEERKVFS